MASSSIAPSAVPAISYTAQLLLLLDRIERPLVQFMACCVGPQQAETRQQKVKHSKTRIQTANRGYSHCVIVRADIVQKTRRTASPSVCGIV
jgi:hypothetical protein